MSKLIHYSGPAGSYILPSGYTRLAYIQSTGTAAIDTGMTFGATTMREFEVMWIDDPASGWIYGANSHGPLEVLLGNTKDYLGGSYTANPIWQQNVRYTIGISTITGNMYCRVNLKTPQRTSTGSANGKKEYLFGVIGAAGSNTVDSYKKWRLYNYKIWDNGVLVRDYVPVQKTDGTIGVLNLVDNSFSTCAGLIAGPFCPQSFPTEQYCLVEWLWNDDRTAWIELPRTLKANTIMKAEMQITNSISGTYQQVMGYATSISWNPYGLGTNNNSWARYSGSVTPSTPPTTAITTVTWTNTGESGEITGSTLGLFKMSGAPGDSSYSRAAIKLLRCLVLEGTTIVMDLIPCYRRLDMLPGVYDIVGRAFYTNTVGKFSLGPSITFGWGEVMNSAPNLTGYVLCIDTDLTKWNIESGVSVEKYSNSNLYKVTNSSHTSSRWGIYKEIDVEPNTKYTTFIYMGAGTRPSLFNIGIAGTFSDTNNITRNSGTGIDRIVFTTAANLTKARIYLCFGCTQIGEYAYFSCPRIVKGEWVNLPTSISYSTIPHNISSGEGRMGEKNESFDFSGTNAYLNTDGLVTGKTYMGWFYTASKPAREVFFADNASGIAFGTYNNGTQAIVAAGTSAKIVFTLSTWNTGWNHIAVVKSDNGLLLYINGIAQTAASSSDVWTHNGGLWIGARSTFDASFSGRCQDFKVFDTVLTQAQIQQEM